MHPDFGRLRLNYEVLLLPDDVDEQRLITWLPADDATADAFARLGDTDAPRVPLSSASLADATSTRQQSRPRGCGLRDDSIIHGDQRALP